MIHIGIQRAQYFIVGFTFTPFSNNLLPCVKCEFVNCEGFTLLNPPESVLKIILLIFKAFITFIQSLQGALSFNEQLLSILTTYRVIFLKSF